MTRRMASVAIIGPDGSGKTTLTRLLMERTEFPFQYLYMGVSWSSSNVLLPTTRLARFLKGRNQPAQQGPEPLSPGSAEAPSSTKRLGRWLSLANKLAEEWYRQLLAYSYQFRGRIPLYDRHFVFDFSFEPAGNDPPAPARLHRFLIQRCYPQPGLVVSLDAPVDLLFERKQEFTPERLEWLRQGYLSLAREFPGIFYVDASRPLETVYEEVQSIVSDYLCGECRREGSALAS